MKRSFFNFRRGTAGILAAMLCAAFLAVAGAHADEPYAPSREYDLKNVRTHLWFDLAKRSIRGDVAESIAMLRENVPEVRFDSVDLTINAVTLDGKPAKFSTVPGELIVDLVAPAKRGDPHEVDIQYQGQPNKGIYFVLPDEEYPQRAPEIWTQGEAEDTRYYIPIYDYPNDRTTSEMILTVPSNWITISNGKLLSIKNEPDGTKTWDWKQSEPLSTYLISAIAGDFAEKDDSWHGIPLRYVVPKPEGFKIDATFPRTKQMLDLFSEKLGVPYPWDQYAQTFVDDFVEGGMENTSATTLTARDLVHPQLAPEERTGADLVESHELAHQWFGDLVTTKDWANLWLNEGFATFFEHYWMEQHYGGDNATYEFWRDQSDWFRDRPSYDAPIVDRNIDDSVEYASNVYTKAGWVLKMLRENLGDENFFRGLHNYLMTNRGQNVVTADLEKAIEQATAINEDEFFHQWVYRAGAPKFTVSYSYNDAAKQVTLTVRQTQIVERLVGIFDVPLDVEIATASGRKDYPIRVNQAEQTFTLPSDGKPVMVLFDKGDQILKAVDFKKTPGEWIYQLNNAETVPDRADAAVALAEFKEDPSVTQALGNAAQHDPFWGIRVESLRALGKIGGPAAEKQVLGAVSDPEPWVRDVAVAQLGSFREDSSLPATLTKISNDDKAFRVRAAALEALARFDAPGAYETLVTAVTSDSPDNTLRDAGLRALGTLGDDRAVPLLLEWTAPGKAFHSRQVAMLSIANLDESNETITNALLSYAHERSFDVSFWALYALGERGDPDAIGPLEAMVQNGDLSMGEKSVVERQIDAIRVKSGKK